MSEPDRTEGIGPVEPALESVRLRATRTGRFEATRMGELLAEATSWLGPQAADSPAAGGLTRHLADLRLSDRFLMRKAAYIDLGQLRSVPEGVAFDVAWRAASLAPLFPVFTGEITVRAAELTLEGHYAPPGGVLGLGLDRALLHLAAQATAGWLLGRLAQAAGEQG